MSMRFFALLLAPVIGGAALAEDPPSLMFSATEVAAVRAALDHKSPAGARTVEKTPAELAGIASIFLSAVSSSNGDQWTVWANGTEITRNRQAEGFQVLEVKDDRVEVLIDGQPPIRVELRPNQTWIRDLGGVIEGRAP